MRIRSIKPEFYRSTDITVLDWETRLIFIALWSYVDDNGVGIDKLSSIVADLFADDLEQDPEGTFARVSRGLQQLAENGRIARYTCDNKKYLYVTNWPKHQKIDRPNKARYPLPDNENPENTPESEQIATPSREYRETPSSGTGEQRNRGTEEQGSGGRGTRGQAGTRIPANFTTTPEMIRWALDNAPNVNHKASTQKFRAHYRSVSGPQQFKTDWTAAWESWLLSDQQRATDKPQQFKTGAEKRLEQGRANHDLFAQMDAERENAAKELTP